MTNGGVLYLGVWHALRLASGLPVLYGRPISGHADAFLQFIIGCGLGNPHRSPVEAGLIIIPRYSGKPIIRRQIVSTRTNFLPATVSDNFFS